ncbi:E set domain-containing protein, partial [Ceratobasidium sp. AG-I]
MRSCSEETTLTQQDKEPSDASVSHLKLARCRARSAPASNLPGAPESAVLPPVIPRADSLLRLDSNTASTDLKKLLSTRVRHAPPSIDTEKANAPGISSAVASPSRDSLRTSRLEPEKSRARVEIYISLNNHVAVEGGNISGTLTLRTRKPRRSEARHVRIDGGRIRVLGFEGISEAERYAFYQCSIPLVEATTDHSQIYQSEPDDDGFRVAREGTFSASFSMQIPKAGDSKSGANAPKGIIQDNSVNAAIKYILLVSFRVRDDSDNASGLDKHADLLNPKITIAHFYRSVELWPTYGPMALHSAEQVHPTLGEAGTVSSRTAQGLLFGGSGMLHLTAVLHRKVWLAGQKCTVYIGVWNETKKSVKSVTLSIIRKAIIARPNQSETVNKKQIAETTLDAVRGPNFGAVTGKGWWAGIEAGATCEFSHIIDIPADALTILRTHVIEVTYVLRVSLVTGSLSSNVSVDLPFNIVNAISTDGLPVPPPS